MTSLYVHVPYCEQKCFYCAFNSKAGSATLDRERFVEAMIRELRRRPSGRRLSTIYVGGGTPSSLEPQLLDSLFQTIKDHYGVQDNYEWTVEVNPGTAVASVLPVLTKHGVNRVSMGVQSMDPARLKQMGRIHSPDDVEDAVRLIRNAQIPRFNLDLIYGQPNQTLDEWNTDLTKILELHPQHLSLYCLQYEDGTLYTKRRDEGRYVDAEEDLTASMFELALDKLQSFGMAWYEVSNFAVSGHESHHNMVYWRNENYEAIGPAAFGRIGNTRYTEWSDVNTWVDAAMEGTSLREEEEVLTARDDALDMLTSGLRTREGISFNEIENRTGINALAGHESRLSEWVERGMAHFTGDRLRLTSRGVIVLDNMLLPFYKTIDAP